LKPGNLLISNSGELKIGDFGAARTFGSPDRKYTAQCVTRHYRAPELLYGADLYGPGVDMWSIGCIFAELMLRVPYFAGDNEFDQLGKIFNALGTPTEEKWPGMKSLSKYVEYETCPETPFKALFSGATDDCIDLLSKMLKFDPNDRISASDALNHKYFSSDPPPTSKQQLMLPTKRAPKKPLQFDYMQAPDENKRKRSPGDDDLPMVKRKLNLDSPI
jgi:cyclin-dependent kinase 7